MNVDYYALLGIPKFCSNHEEIRRAYLAQVRFFHPDARNVAPEIAHEKTQFLNLIYDTLTDPDKKKVYDDSLRAQNHSSECRNYAAQNTYTGRNPPENSASYSRQNVETNNRAHNLLHRSRAFQIFAVLLIIFAIPTLCCALINFISHKSVSSNSSNQAAHYSEVSTTAKTVTETTTGSKPVLSPLPVPKNGEILYHNSLDQIAPFTIKTSGTGYYLVKLKDHYSGENAITVFIHAGNTVDLDVPLGTFDLVYASGETWYGLAHLFGDDTVCAKAMDLFSFYLDGDYVSGWTVTLYPVYNGNLSTEAIDIDDF